MDGILVRNVRNVDDKLLMRKCQLSQLTIEHELVLLLAVKVKLIYEPSFLIFHEPMNYTNYEHKT